MRMHEGTRRVTHPTGSRDSTRARARAVRLTAARMPVRDESPWGLDPAQAPIGACRCPAVMAFAAFDSSVRPGVPS